MPNRDEPFVQSVRLRVRVPEVVALTHYDRTLATNVTFSRRNIFKRDRFTCQYCGVQPGTDELTLDHVVPRAQSGTSTWENCVLACVACNKHKELETTVRLRVAVLGLEVVSVETRLTKPELHVKCPMAKLRMPAAPCRCG